MAPGRVFWARVDPKGFQFESGRVLLFGPIPVMRSRPNCPTRDPPAPELPPPLSQLSAPPPSTLVFGAADAAMVAPRAGAGAGPGSG